MEIRKVSVLLAVAVLALVLTAPAWGGKTSVEYGKQLFNDPALGGSTTDQGCNACHANGKGLENTFSGKSVSKKVNRCLTNHMAGTKIDGRSAEMRSLKGYIQSMLDTN